MRLAVFSDVHGQIDRLSACLHSIARVGADEVWCLGDTVDAFAVRQPELVVACVNAIDEVCAVKLTGNHEAWALLMDLCPTPPARCWRPGRSRHTGRGCLPCTGAHRIL